MRVRARLCAAVAVFAMIATMAGCSVLPSPRPAAAAHPSGSAGAVLPSGAVPSGGFPSGPVPSGPPAAATAGGACLLLDFNVINAALGSTFDVAAAATSSETYTCDVQTTAATYPDLTLTVTATDLLPLDFTATVAPAGSTSVPKLGKIGYVLQVAATAKLGAGGRGRMAVRQRSLDHHALHVRGVGISGHRDGVEEQDDHACAGRRRHHRLARQSRPALPRG